MTRHRFHGNPARFEVVAAFVADRFAGANYVADVAGGQGMLARILTKHHQMECEVIDPRGWTLKGVTHTQSEYSSSMADYYDVVVALHPDEALPEVVASALIRPTVVIPCCNFWDRSSRLGRDALLTTVTEHHRAAGGTVEDVTFDFTGPKNRGLVLSPPAIRACPDKRNVGAL